MASNLVTKECENCHQVFTKIVQKGRLRRFCSQKCSHEYQRGSNHPRWQAGPNKGGFQRKHQLWTPENWDDGLVDGRGYFRVCRPDYPRAYNEGYAKRYHVVWWLETSRVVPDGYVIHHKDHNKTNDRFDNLELVEHGQHTRRHNQPRVETAKVFHCCMRCNKLFSLTRARTNEGKYGRGKYCSQKCYHAGPHKTFSEMYEERICLWCQKPFVIRKSVLKHTRGCFCSTKCAAKHTIGRRWASRKLRSNV